jgi:RNA polymerase sigma-70 factor (family 1)
VLYSFFFIKFWLYTNDSKNVINLLFILFCNKTNTRHLFNVFMVNKFDNVSDNLLVISIRDDNKDAFKSLYDRYSKKLYYFSLRYFYSKEEAEELVQSVFKSIWEHRKSLDPAMLVKNYIYRSAVNFIYNYLKKKAIRARFIETEMQKGEPHSNHTYDQVFFHDLERAINSIVETLPTQQQKVFQLSRFEGLSHKEIAKKLDLSVRTVENNIYRALKIIKENLKGEIFLTLFILGSWILC